MNTADLFVAIIVGGALIFLAFFVIWSLCVISSINDEISDKIWEEYCEKQKKEKKED